VNSNQPKPEPLLPLIASGDSGAVTEFLDRYGGLVWSLVRGSIKNREQTEDVVQEVFISVWKAAGRYDPALGSESLFVTTIARRRLIDRFRQSVRGPEVTPIEDVVVAEADANLEEVDARDEVGLALDALKQLKPQQQRVLQMWAVNGMTHSEIATSTGIPLGTVKSQIRRGLQRVRELLGTQGATREVTA